MTISNANLNKVPVDGGYGTGAVQWDPSLGRACIKEPGSYLITGSVTISATGNANNVKTVQVYKDGKDVGWYATKRCVSTTPYETIVTPTFIGMMDAGSYLELYFKDESGSATIGHTFLTVLKVS